jgi:outer membrane murein-binding lipoprotein Lpp
MQLKPITAIAVLLLVAASLLVAGCTSNNTSTNNQTPNASTATHDAFLENYLAAYKNNTYADKNAKITVWETTWINSTSVQLLDTIINKTANRTWSYDETLIVFPTTQDATNYLNAMNKTAYSLASTQYEHKGAYYNVTGHAPQIYKYYVWNEGNPFNFSEYKQHVIFQFDNLVDVYTAKSLS